MLVTLLHPFTSDLILLNETPPPSRKRSFSQRDKIHSWQSNLFSYDLSLMLCSNPNFDLLSLSGVFDPLFYSADGAPPDSATTRLSQAPPINMPLNAEAIAPTRRNPPARTSLLGKRRPDPDDEVKRQQS